VQFCIGVRKAGENLVAHSWVTLHGTPIPRHDEDRSFALVYRYPHRGQVGSSSTTAAEEPSLRRSEAYR
jgi:hypothetical protein